MAQEIPGTAVMDTGPIKEQLIRHEGLKLRPYLCTAGKLTIGVGRNLTDTGISLDEAMQLLENDVARVIKELENGFPWFPGLDPVRKEALVDMCFNLGFPRFFKFKMMIDALRQGDFESASREMLESRWALQVGKRADTLSKMIKTGERQAHLSAPYPHPETLTDF